MAAAHLAGQTPLLQHGSMPFEGASEGGEKGVRRLLRDERHRAQRAVVHVQDRGDSGCPSVIEADRGAAMELRDAVCKVGDQGRGERMALRHVVEKVVLREAAHFHDCVDEGTGAVEGQPPVYLPGDPANPEVECGRRAAVQDEFGLAEGQPARGCREIKVGKANGALELERTVADHEDGRDVRRDSFDRDPQEGGLAFEESDGLGQILDGHGRFTAVGGVTVGSDPEPRTGVRDGRLAFM